MCKSIGLCFSVFLYIQSDPVITRPDETSPGYNNVVFHENRCTHTERETRTRHISLRILYSRQEGPELSGSLAPEVLLSYNGTCNGSSSNTNSSG